MLTTGELLFALHKAEDTGIHSFNVENCARKDNVPLVDTPYTDIEGLIWTCSSPTQPEIDDDAKRSMVSEANMLFAGFKTEIGTYYADMGTWPTSIQELGSVRLVGVYVTSSVYTLPEPNSPQIVMTMTTDWFEPGMNQIGWKLIGNSWSCKASENGGLTTLQTQYLPMVCQ